MSSQYPHDTTSSSSSSSYNPDEINIDGITDYLSTLQTSTPYDQSQQTPYTLLQSDAPVYRSLMIPEEVIHDPAPQHVNKDLGDVSISLDTYGQPHHHDDYYASLLIPSPQHRHTTSIPVTLHHTSSSSLFSPHTPPSFEQQASTQSLPPASPTLSTDSSSSSSVSVSYSTSHFESEYPPPSHDSLMRNDSCVSVYHEMSSHRRDDIIDDVESELEDSDSCMPEADSDDLPPIHVYPRLIRQNGIYRQPSITSF